MDLLVTVVIQTENAPVKPATLETNVVNAKVVTTRMTLPENV